MSDVRSPQQSKTEEALRESEERFSTIFRQSPTGMSISRPSDGLLVDVNDAFCDICGYSREELLGRSSLELGLWACAEERARLITLLREQGRVRRFEAQFGRKSGKTGWLLISADLILLNGQQHLLGIHTEITELKLAEAALRASEDRFRTLAEASFEGIVITVAGKIVDCNQQLSQILGYSPEELRGMDVRQCVVREDHERVLNSIFQGAESITEQGVIRKDGQVITMESHGKTVWSEGRAMRLTAVRDITARKQAEESLRESERRQNAILDTIPDPAWLKDKEGRFLMVNAAWRRFYGMDTSKVLGKTGFDLFPAEVAISYEQQDCSVMQSGHALHVEELANDKDGCPIWFEKIKCPLFNDQGDVVGITGLAREITERKRAEQELRHSEQRLKNMINSSLVAIGIGDATGRITEVNDAFVRLLGYSREELLSGTVTWHDFTPPEYRDLDNRCMEELERNGKLGPYEKENIRKDGTRVPILVGVARLPGTVVEHVAFIVDITDRKRVEQEKLEVERRLLHAQKLESIGILAGGIAHDFNNILAGIMGYADLALLHLSASEPARADIEVIKKAVRRAADLTRQMLAYSGKGQFIVEPVDLSRLVEDSKKMLAMSVSKKAKMNYNFGFNVPPIQADAAQMCQIVMNLVINASEALGEQTGVISISTSFFQCKTGDLSGVELDQDLPDGLYVCLEVADSGCGMDEQTRARIFDPFFTTKFAGRGLGLAAVHGIVRGHKGAIQVSSEPGKGTTFRVFLPASGHAIPVGRNEPQPAPQRRRDTILVVDDEEMIRTVTRRMIEHAGFQVLTAGGGREAIRLFGEHQHEVSCVLLDLTMPDMDGAETFRELSRIRPDVRVILASGYGEQAATERFSEKGLTGFIQKPYQVGTLIARIQQALGSVDGI